MILFSYYSVSTFSNMYVVGCPESGEALIIDPARFEAPILDFIESRGMELTSVLVTRVDETHDRGIRTLRRIYDAKIFAGVPEVAEMPATLLEDREPVRVGTLEVTPIAIPVHSQDMFSLLLGHVVFTGPVLQAGTVGVEHPGYAGVLLREMLTDRLLSLPGETLVLPREGPPTTIGLERAANPQLTPSPKE